jgi:hypothetical protein
MRCKVELASAIPGRPILRKSRMFVMVLLELLGWRIEKTKWKWSSWSKEQKVGPFFVGGVWVGMFVLWMMKVKEVLFDVAWSPGSSPCMELGDGGRFVEVDGTGMTDRSPDVRAGGVLFCLLILIVPSSSWIDPECCKIESDFFRFLPGESCWSVGARGVIELQRRF